MKKFGDVNNLWILWLGIVPLGPDQLIFHRTELSGLFTIVGVCAFLDRIF